MKDSRRHAMEAYDHIEGEAELAKKQLSFKDDGVIDKHEQKEIDKAHKRQLISRGRGPAQFKPYRQAKWMAKGIVDRLPGRDKTRERESTACFSVYPFALPLSHCLGPSLIIQLLCSLRRRLVIAAFISENHGKRNVPWNQYVLRLLSYKGVEGRDQGENG